jgi:hypothetical protein
MTAKELGKGSIDAGLDDAPFAPVVAAEPNGSGTNRCCWSAAHVLPIIADTSSYNNRQGRHRAGGRWRRGNRGYFVGVPSGHEQPANWHNCVKSLGVVSARLAHSKNPHSMHLQKLLQTT